MNTPRNTAPNGREQVRVEITGQDGNAFAIIGRCVKAMRRAGWTNEEMDAFREAVTDGDYNHLLVTVMDYCQDTGSSEEDEEEDENEEMFEDEDEAL